MSRLTRDDIIASAGRRFATHGYHGTSMRDLGDDLGILGSSIYAHVGGKQELLVAVIERGAAFFEAAAAAAREQGDGPESVLRLLVAGHIDVVLDHRAEARTYLSETHVLEPGVRASIAATRDRYERVFVDTIADGVDAGVFGPTVDPRLAAIYVLSVLNTIDRWFDERGRITRTDLADDVNAFVLRGLVGGGGSG
jgi:AcrR family transcriptional regulator